MESQRKVIYLDNAATSWPKPDVVLSAVQNHALHFAANPGRAGHRMAADAARVVYDSREAVARLLGISDSRYLVFMQNATEGLNTVIHGLLKPGDHVVTSSMEHNSVMRPLRRQREQHNVTIDMVQADAAGRLDAAAVARALRPQTRLVIINHASNVVGTIAPVAGIKQAIGDVPLLVDAAQTAGAYPIDVERDGIDLLACTGHKSLLGPQGTGCLYISERFVDRIVPLMSGGTGSNSESDAMPESMPDHFEAGTRNGMGIAGLGAAAGYLQHRGVDAIRSHELELTRQLLAGLEGTAGVTEYGPADAAERTATVSINIEGLTPSEVGYMLDRRYNIAVRVGLHCSPMAHRTLGTYPSGTVRLSPGALTTGGEIEATLAAIRNIAAEVNA